MSKQTKTVIIVVIVLVALGILIAIVRRNNSSRVSGCTNPVTGETGTKVGITGPCQSASKVAPTTVNPTVENTYYVPVVYPSPGPSPAPHCPVNTPGTQYRQRTREGCVSAYSTPDGKTWTLDNSKSTRDCCAYSTSAPPPPPPPTTQSKKVPPVAGIAQSVPLVGSQRIFQTA